jgi:hypothetical protein
MMPHNRQSLLLCLHVLVFAVFPALAACAPATPAGSTVPPAATIDSARLAFASQEDAAIAAPLLVQTERNAASTGDLALLAELWAEDATIVERRGTVDEADDYTFAGRAAILDRYLVAVAQNPPAPLTSPPDAPVTVAGDTATMVNGVDTWTFVYQNDRWWIQDLVIAP